jgi:hypothetical protein
VTPASYRLDRSIAHARARAGAEFLIVGRQAACRTYHSLLTLGLVASTAPARAPAAPTGASTLRVRATAQQGGCRVGDEVEAYDGGWYNATVTPIGTGRNAGDCLVHYDNFSTDRALPGGRVTGEGRYAYDAATATVRWLSGRYRDEE